MMQHEINPYIGPRPFERNVEDAARFFGRLQETKEITSLILGHPVVLVYAQSGAGKTSLFNTSVALTLEEKGFDVLPLTRVGGVVPKGVDPHDVRNLYIFNALLKIDTDTDPKDLLATSLADFLEKRVRPINESNKPNLRAVIFDQFEELITNTPRDWSEQRIEFFRQIEKAIESDPLLRVVFVIREDFLAELDPYARNLRERLRIRYRLERLGKNAALRAIKDPLIKTPREFAPGVAEELVNGLLTMSAMDATGRMTEIEGQYVEPVQLQVVCVTLWSSLEPGVTEIRDTHLKNFNVNDALSNFYISAIESASQETGVSETKLRNWFGKILITPMGTRSTVFRSEHLTGGIENEVVDFLESRHIVRAEYRAGARWYELTHDRLIKPIIESNQKWLETLSPLRRQAVIWNDQKRNEAWLLKGSTLDELSKWAEEHKAELTDLDQEFLNACKKQQERDKEREQARSARRLRNFLIVVGTLAFIAIIATIVALTNLGVANKAREQALQEKANADNAKSTAVAASTAAINESNIASTAQANAEDQQIIAEQQRQNAEKQANLALAGNLAAQADSLRNTNYPLSLLLGVEAFQRDRDSLLTRTTLFQLLQFTPYKLESGIDGSVSAIAVSQDGTLIAAASCGNNEQKRCLNGEIKLFDAGMEETPQKLSDIVHDFGFVYSLAFHEYDGGMRVLAAGGCVPNDSYGGCTRDMGQIVLWDVTDPKNPHLLANTLTSGDTSGKYSHAGRVKTLAFSPDGLSLASGSYDQKIIIWDISNIRNLVPKNELIGHISFVNSVVFIDDTFLASAGDDRKILVWDLSRPEKSPRSYRGQHTAPVNSLVYNSEKKLLASAGDDNLVFLWNWDSENHILQNPVKLEGHSGFVKSLAFDENGNMLASAGFDNTVILWDIELDDDGNTVVKQIGPALNVHTDAINGVAFGIEDGLPYLVSGSDDRTIIRWDLSARRPLSFTLKSDTPDPQLNVNDEFQLNGQQIELTAQLNGQQIELISNSLASASNPLFLVLDGFTQDTTFGFVDQKLITIEDLNGWLTEWVIEPDEWIKNACLAANRNLSSDELERYLKLTEDQTFKNDYMGTCP